MTLIDDEVVGNSEQPNDTNEPTAFAFYTACGLVATVFKSSDSKLHSQLVSF